MAMIDYGAMVFCDGKFVNKNDDLFQDMKKAVGWDDFNNNGPHLHDNYFAYIGNPQITFAFYKFFVKIAIGGKITDEIWRNRTTQTYKSHTYTFDNIQLHIKSVLPNVFHASTIIDGHHYHVIYGYGIDPNIKCWNKVKVQYLGKRGARKVDNLIRRYWKGA